MSDEEKNAGEGGTATAAASVPSEQPSLDEHTTEPNAPQPEKPAPQAATAKWQMPKPKFQQTSGYLPQGYLNKVKQRGIGTQPETEAPTADQPAFVPSPATGDGDPVAAAIPAVEPQPDLADQLIPEEPVDGTEVRAAARKGSRIPVFVFWLVGAVLFIVVLLFVVFFLILAKPAVGNNF